jgi:AcrR family transcriptional regulator
MKSTGARRYSSPLRAEHAAATRERIVDAAVELLQGADPGAFGMPDVAERAGVSVSTVYRAFPTKDDLVAGVLAAIRERFERSAGAPPRTREELEASVPGAVRAVYELEPQYRALFATAAGREAHRATAGHRSASVDRAFFDGLDGMDARQRRLVTSMLHLVTSSTSVLWLKDYAGLDADDAAEAVAWALTALTEKAQEEAGR